MNKLRKELASVGASEDEIRSLLLVAASLSSLKPKTTRSWMRPVGFSIAGLVVGVFIIVLAQASLPSSFLFPIQKATDNLAAAITPSYRVNVMMKRADQVNQLVVSHSNNDVIMATLKDYTNEAQAYEMTVDNYTAFSYCKARLLEAAKKADPQVRTAINDSLRSIETT